MRLDLLRRYFEQQRRQGSDRLSASLRLPPNVARYVVRSRMEGHQIEGYGRFDLPLLASYSRSGTNWVRYIIEWISGHPTPGQVRLHYGTDFVIDRAHRAYPVMDRYPRVLLLVRDYHECLVRHHQGLWKQLQDVEVFLQDQTVYQRPDWYIKNIAAFDELSCPRLVVYYEDLVADPRSVIRDLTVFLQLDLARAERFIDDLDRHRQESVGAYTAGGHESVTSGSSDFSRHSRDHLTSEERRAFDDYYRTRHPHLFEQYLERYAASAEKL